MYSEGVRKPFRFCGDERVGIRNVSGPERMPSAAVASEIVDIIGWAKAARLRLEGELDLQGGLSAQAHEGASLRR
jgi:hypothetical protein